MTEPTGRRLTESRVGELQRELGHLEGRIDELARKLDARDMFAERLHRELSAALIRTANPPNRGGPRP